jgi:hypothetical protein
MMRLVITIFSLAFFLCLTAQAQTSTDNSSPASQAAATPQQTDPSTNSKQEPLPPVTLKHRPNPPDSPPPKANDERRTCPGGNGKPCAVLGGRLYFSDSLALSKHSQSWSAAATSPAMLLALGLLTASTIADIETTQSCIKAGTCKEGNPLLGQSRAQAYSVTMSINALAFWATAEQKRHGHGAVPFFILWSATAMHAAFAAHNSALAAK